MVICRTRAMAAGTHWHGTTAHTKLDFNGLALVAHSCSFIYEAGEAVAMVQNRDQPHDKETDWEV